MKLILKILLMLLPILAIGQNKTYVGVQLGPKFEIYQYEDNGDGLFTKPFFHSSIYGLTIGREINKTFVGEIGLFINDYGESYRIKGDFGYGTSNAILALQIPLRLKARLNLIHEKLDLTTTIGYHFAINTDYESSGSGSTFTSSSGPESNDSTRTQSISTYNLKKSYGLIETGIALEYELKNSLKLVLSANYVTGFNRIVEVEIDYWINEDPVQTGKVFSMGNYYSVTFGLSYPISHFWVKKPED
jgi:hypothetical protein